MEIEVLAKKITKAVKKAQMSGIDNPKIIGFLIAIELGNGKRRGRKKADSGKTA